MTLIKVLKIKFILFTLLLGNVSHIDAQSCLKPDLSILKIKDSLYLYLDNSANNWFSFEVNADTVYPIERFIIADNKALQINLVRFSSKSPSGVMDDHASEEIALKKHSKWELKYQSKTLKKRLKSEYLSYRNKDNKPFLIWWHNVPEIKEKGSKFDFVISNDASDGTGNEKDADSCIVYNVSFMIYLSFIIDNNQVVAISIPVYQNEDIVHSIDFLKKIAESVKSYGGKINIYYLKKKIESPDDYELSDFRNLIKIKLPEYMTVLEIPYERSFMFTFPEIGQIINVALIRWDYSDSTDNLNTFVDKVYSSNNREDLRNIVNEINYKEYKFTSDNGRFIYHDVFVKGKNVMYRVLFTATNTTYDFNLSRFMNFLKGIEIEP